MKFILTTHNVTLTKAIEDHVLIRIDKLEHLDRWAIDARVSLEHDNTKAPERLFKCSIRLGVRGPDLYAEDYDGDLYNRTVRVRMLHRLRGERKFAGIDELRAQIFRDRARAIRYFDSQLVRRNLPIV